MKKKKVGYKTDGLNNEETNKQKRNRNNEVDGTVVKGDCNCYQSKIFVKKISAEQKRQKRNKWK